MSNDTTGPVQLRPAAGTATHSLLAHANGDHRPDERGPQDDCPSCTAARS